MAMRTGPGDDGAHGQARGLDGREVGRLEDGEGDPGHRDTRHAPAERLVRGGDGSSAGTAAQQRPYGEQENQAPEGAPEGEREWA